MEDKRISLAKELKNKFPEKLNILVGFDGFIDEIIHVVDKRIDSETFNRIETIDGLAKRIEKASGLSTNLELVPLNKKIGGNGPIMCNALAKHDPNITYIGALGYPSINDVFAPMKDKVKIFSIAEAAHTDAVEFYDGKLMLGKMKSLNDVNYERLLDKVGETELIRILNEIDLLATVNWSMLPHLTELWQKLIKHILPKLDKRNNKPYLFVDIADPEKRENSEIKEALDLLKSFCPYFKVIIGFNKKEAYQVGNVLGLFDAAALENMQVAMEDLNESLYEYLKIDGVVIHPVDRSSCVIGGQYYEEMGPYIAKPKLSTGAGDNFNAGFILGLLLGLNPDQALLTGMSTSGYYVRNAESPEFSQLIKFIEKWAKNQIEE